MENEPQENRPARRYIRIAGPFDGYHVGPPRSPILIYDLNLGGGLVSFIHERPAEALLVLEISLPYEGRITVHAEPVSHQQFGIGVRFVDLEGDALARLARTVEVFSQPGSAPKTTMH